MVTATTVQVIVGGWGAGTIRATPPTVIRPPGTRRGAGVAGG